MEVDHKDTQGNLMFTLSHPLKDLCSLLCPSISLFGSSQFMQHVRCIPFLGCEHQLGEVRLVFDFDQETLTARLSPFCLSQCPSPRRGEVRVWWK